MISCVPISPSVLTAREERKISTNPFTHRAAQCYTIPTLQQIFCTKSCPTTFPLCSFISPSTTSFNLNDVPLGKEKEASLHKHLSSYLHQAGFASMKFLSLPGLEVDDVSAVYRTATQKDRLSLLLGQNPEHGDLQGYVLGKELHKPAHFQRHETGRFLHNPKTCPIKEEGHREGCYRTKNTVLYQH